MNPVDRVMPLASASTAISATGVDGGGEAERGDHDGGAQRWTTTSTERNPNRLISGVVAGLIPTLPAKTNAVTAPDFTGDQPNCALEQQRQQERHRADHQQVHGAAELR